MKKHKKNPWIAALLNLLFLGAGYIYNGRRLLVGISFMIFGFSVAFSTILPSPQFSESFLSQYMSSLTETDLNILSIQGFLEMFYILIPIALAYDAYKEAQEINGRN